MEMYSKVHPRHRTTPLKHIRFLSFIAPKKNVVFDEKFDKDLFYFGRYAMELSNFFAWKIR